MALKCINCAWEGTEEQAKGPLKFCPNCGDYTKETTPVAQPNPLDLNKDGAVDKADAEIAKKVISATKPVKRR